MSQQNRSNDARKVSHGDRGNASSNKKTTNSKKKKPKFKISSVVNIIFIVYIACFLAYMVQVNKTNKIPTKEDSIMVGDSTKVSAENDVTSTTEDDASIMAINPIAEGTPVGEEYLDTCMFIGDSISEGFSSYFFLDDANVLAQKGLRPDTVCTETISNLVYGDILAIDGILQSGFKNIYIMLGSNGIGWNDNEKMVDGYREFIQLIQEEVPDANIYVVSIPPVSALREDTSVYATVEDGLIYNTTIDELNALYLDLANEMNVYYLDINSYLKDDTGKLPYDSSSDGIHFDSATYQKVLDYVCSHVAE
ncbi:MAG: GDSL-type esterase/lipase family protein [Ruminococcus sp.]|nr:GDSL-type esterase/lipase family protein [Ruminococcus sp.]